ncbi:PDZ domain-containing protein [Muricauda sp. JGD-17]|uniref:PDZ domain-containing protein n=1 Tax=Flagellimonas ochracea TaxID=2696472 RepID=A0A964TBP3_9FLAO|nr:aspartyl protease family protein [Allomuricauda ochracea]NAY91918.1 PDZ domain-containing protein [Allomuricauda ochracea]
MKKILVCFLVTYLGLVTSGKSQNDPSFLTKVEIETDFNLIFMPIMIHGHSYTMILDTGAGFSVLDEEVAKALNLNIENVRIMERPGGEVRLGTIKNLNYSVGNHSAEMTIASANLAEGGFNDYIGRPCAGILGADFISKYAMEINYFEKLLSLYSPDTYKIDGNKKKLSLVDGMPIVKSSLHHKDQTIEGSWLIDTGSMMSLGVNESFFGSYLKNNVNTYESLAVGFGGSTSGKMYKLDGFDLLGNEFNHIIAGHAEDGINDASFDGVIGGELISRFTIAFNYATKEIHLKPNAKKDNPIRWDLIGMLLAQTDKGIEVLHVYKNSPADHAQIQKGDLIAFINGKRAEAIGLPKIWETFHTKEGLAIALIISKDGIMRCANVVLRDYFNEKAE